MTGFFNPDNWFWRGFGKIADFFALSCFWLLCSAPLITVVPASVALYDCAAHCIYGNESEVYRRFFRTFKNELKRGIPMSLLWAAIAFILNAGFQVVRQMDADGALSIFSAVYFCTLFLPLGVACWAIAIESRFDHGFIALHHNALMFTFAHLPQTFCIVVLFVLTLNLCLNFIFLLMILPGIMVTLQAFFIEKVFKKYIPDEEAEETNEE